MFIKLLRKLNTKIAIRLIMILIVVLAIMGSFHLFELLQNVYSNYSVSILIKKLILVYFVPVFSISFAFYMLAYYLFTPREISFKTFKKASFFAFAPTLLIPGFLYFPEVYGFDTTMLILPMSAVLIIVILSRFLQNFTDEQIGIMKSELKKLIHNE